MNCAPTYKSIRSKYLLQKVFGYTSKSQRLGLAMHCRDLQEKLEIGIDDYKKYYDQIEIDVFPLNGVTNTDFINVPKSMEQYVHVFFSGDEEEKKINQYHQNVEKIKIILDKEFDEFENLFSDLPGIKKIKFQHFQRKNIYDMSGMFDGCENIEKIVFKQIKTDNVVTMSFMFNNCKKLKRIKHLSNFNTQNVEDMNSMFSGCKQIKKIDISGFNFRDLKDTGNMFDGCSSLKKIKGLENLNGENIEDVYAMFAGCSELKEANLCNLKSKKITNMSSMFYNCSSLEKVNLEKAKIKNVQSTSCMFYNCKKLEHVNYKFPDYPHGNPNVRNHHMFFGCLFEIL